MITKMDHEIVGVFVTRSFQYTDYDNQQTIVLRTASISMTNNEFNWWNINPGVGWSDLSNDDQHKIRRIEIELGIPFEPIEATISKVEFESSLYKVWRCHLLISLRELRKSPSACIAYNGGEGNYPITHNWKN